MSIFKKKVPPLTREENEWLIIDLLEREREKERTWFDDDETYRDFLEWRTRILNRNPGYRPQKFNEKEEIWRAWVSEYYAEKELENESDEE